MSPLLTAPVGLAVAGVDLSGGREGEAGEGG